MSYILSGDSGTVVFDRTGTITNESPTMSSQVTSNPIEGGGKITDHAVLDPIKFSITGIVSTAAGYATLEAMWRNRDLLTYRGAEAFNNLLIINLKRTRACCSTRTCRRSGRKSPQRNPFPARRRAGSALPHRSLPRDRP